MSQVRISSHIPSGAAITFPRKDRQRRRNRDEVLLCSSKSCKDDTRLWSHRKFRDPWISRCDICQGNAHQHCVSNEVSQARTSETALPNNLLSREDWHLKKLFTGMKVAICSQPSMVCAPTEIISRLACKRCRNPHLLDNFPALLTLFLRMTLLIFANLVTASALWAFTKRFQFAPSELVSLVFLEQFLSHLACTS